MEDLDGLLELDKSQGIYIDIGTKLFMNIDGVNFGVTSVFIGMLRDEFMIATLPKRYKSVKNKLFPSNQMVVKYLFEGSVYAFQTSVIEMITTPIKALVLEYPKVVQETELRMTKRKNVIIPGRIKAKKAEADIVAFDMSKNGCRFKYHDIKHDMATLREGDLFRIFCRFPGVSEEVGAMACVKNVAREGSKLSIGAQFQDPTKEFISPLMHFLYTIEDFI